MVYKDTDEVLDLLSKCGRHGGFLPYPVDCLPWAVAFRRHSSEKKYSLFYLAYYSME